MTITPGPWAMTKCPCSHPSCDQWTIATQSSVGFSHDDARAIAEVPAMVDALRDAERSLDEFCRDQHPDNVCCHTLRNITAILARIDKED